MRGRCIGCMALVSTSTEMAAAERVAEHGENVGVHERLAAGEADLPRGQRLALDLIEEGGNLGAVDIGEPVVLRARIRYSNCGIRCCTGCRC